MEEFDLQKKETSSGLPGILGGSKDGQPEWSFLPTGSWLDNFRFFYLYGLDIFVRIRNIVRPLVADLGKIYEKQEKGVGFETLGRGRIQ